MALSKKDFVSEARRLRKLRPAQRQLEMRTVTRIFKKANPKFSEERFKSYVRYGTEEKKAIAKMQSRPKKRVVRRKGKLRYVKQGGLTWNLPKTFGSRR